LTFQHRADVSPYTASYDFARTCVFNKQSLPPAICDPTQLQTHSPSPDRAPLLPKLRGQFAEFLNHGSPERLGILYLTTCVGLGYWPHTNSLEAFLDSTGSLTSPKTARHHASATNGARIYLHTGLHAYPRTTATGSSYPPASPHHFPTTRSAPTPATPHNPKAMQDTGTVSITCLGTGRSRTGTGISTRSPSTTPVGLALGPDSPWADQPGPGTLGHPAAEILTLLSLLMPAFSLPRPPPFASATASQDAGRSPTHPHHSTRPR